MSNNVQMREQFYNQHLHQILTCSNLPRSSFTPPTWSHIAGLIKSNLKLHHFRNQRRSQLILIIIYREIKIQEYKNITTVVCELLSELNNCVCVQCLHRSQHVSESLITINDVRKLFIRSQRENECFQTTFFSDD